MDQANKTNPAPVSMLARAAAHGARVKEIPVPWWSADPSNPDKIYCRPLRAAVYRTCKRLATSDNGAFDEVMFCALLIEKCAETDDGQPLFKAGEHQQLIADADVDIILVLGRAIGSAWQADAMAERKKN
jgi:hypothetical protein